MENLYFVAITMALQKLVELVHALGTIILTNEFLDVSDIVPSAASALNHQLFRLVESYINSTE